MRKGEIYTLSDPDTGYVKYVGFSDNVKERYTRHLSLSNKSNLKKREWIIELNKLNKKPVLEIIDKGSYDIEDFWIDQFKSWGFDLLNVSKLESANRISKKLKNRIISENHRKELSKSGKKYIYIVKKNSSVIGDFDSIKSVSKFTGISNTHVSRLCANYKLYTKDGVSICRINK